MAGYTKDFLLDAICSRYKEIHVKVPGAAEKYREMCSNYYDQVGKDKFRVSASLDAAEIKKYKLALTSK